MLLESKADPNIKNHKNLSPADLLLDRTFLDFFVKDQEKKKKQEEESLYNKVQTNQV